MADERVVIRIDVNADTRGIDRVRRKLRELAAEAEVLDRRMRRLNGSLDENADAADRVSLSHGKASRSLRDHDVAQDRFSKRLRKSNKDMDFSQKMVNGLSKAFGVTLKFGLIGAAIELAAVGVALASVNGLLGIGAAAVKVYRFAMNGLAAAAAGVVVALSTVAAAQREYNAAINAYNYRSAPQLGSSTAQAMSAMRNLSADARLGAFGMQNLNAAFAAVSKNAEMTGGLQNALAGLGNFAVAAGGDIGKNLTAAGEFLGLLQKEGNLTEEVLSAASAVGPQFQKAIEEAKKKGMTGAAEIITALSSGDLAKQAGVENSLNAVNETLIGRLKAFLTQMQTLFGDFGQMFLPQVKEAFDRIASTMRVAFTRISGSISAFGTGGILNSVVTVTEKAVNTVVNLFDKYLPKAQDMFSWIPRSFRSVKYFFDQFSASLRELSDGAKVITDTFGPIFGTLFRNLGESIRTLSQLAVENRDEFLDFSDGFSEALTSIQDLFNGFKELVVTALPGITSALRVVANVFNFIREAIEGVVGALKTLTGAFGSEGAGGFLGAALGIGGLFMAKGAMDRYTGKKSLAGAAYGSARSRFVPGQGGGGGIGSSTGIMNVSAGVVNVMGGGMAPGGSPAGMPVGPGGVGPNSKWRPGYTVNAQGKYVPIQGQRNVRNAARMDRMKEFGARNAGNIAGLGGMALLYGGAGEEAAPFLAAGSALAFVNPLAGLAVGGLGTAATAQSQGGGVAAGALGGAAAGALIGTALGGPVVGTAIGAALGAGFGFIMGGINQENANRKADREMGKGFTYEQGLGPMVNAMLVSGPEAAAQSVSKVEESLDRVKRIQDQFKTADNGAPQRLSQEERTRRANEMVTQGLITQAEAALLSAKHMDEAIKSADKHREALMEYQTVMGDEQTRKIDILRGVTGQTDEELRKLARTMGVDLGDGMMSVSEAMDKLGISLVRTKEEIDSMGRKSFADAINQFITQPKEIEKATLAMDQAGEALRQFGTSASESQVRDFIETLFTNALTLNNGDMSAALEYVNRSVGSVFGTAFQTQDGVLGPLADPGMAQMFADRGGFNLVAQISNKARTDFASAQASNLAGVLASDFQVGMSGGDRAVLQQKIFEALGQNTDQSRQLLDRVTNLLANPPTAADGTALQGEDLATAFETSLANVGIDVDFQSIADSNQSAMEATQNMSDAAKQMAESVRSAFARPDWFNNLPAWWNGVMENDTKTPRAQGDATSSRLGRTMSRHGFFDSQLSGKRTVTSSWRNWGLGSINSDHVTGNAYDLTGQNLGAYATMVNKMGGFAEFHGAAGGRHLHVVPGQTPVGDAMSPVGVASTPVSVGGATYNVTVNALPGQDVNAIAAAVMAQIESKERSNRERA